MITDAAMGEAALASIPTLSPDEAALTSAVEMSAAEREVAEDWLYFHLDCARRARESMDRLAWGSEYEFHFGTRRRAIEAATHHLRRLYRAGAQLPPLLERMVQREEITS